MSKKNPAIYKVRESDLPRAYRKYVETVNGVRTKHWWTSDGDWAANEVETPEEVRSQIRHHLRKIAVLKRQQEQLKRKDFRSIQKPRQKNYMSKFERESIEWVHGKMLAVQLETNIDELRSISLRGHNVDC